MKFFFFFSPTGNMNPDDFDLSMKSWRNKSPGDKQSYSNFESNGNNMQFNNENADDFGPFPQQSPNDDHPLAQLKNAIHVKEESFSMSMYILLILTLAVLVLFLNCYYKRRNTVRTRRKCFPFNKLGFWFGSNTGRFKFRDAIQFKIYDKIHLLIKKCLGDLTKKKLIEC